MRVCLRFFFLWWGGGGGGSDSSKEDGEGVLNRPIKGNQETRLINTKTVSFRG